MIINRIISINTKNNKSSSNVAAKEIVKFSIFRLILYLIITKQNIIIEMKQTIVNERPGFSLILSIIALEGFFLKIIYFSFLSPFKESLTSTFLS